MSGKLAGRVWDSALAPELKPLAACLADFASDNGENIFPSVSRLSWRLGKSESTVQRGLKALKEIEVLAVVRPGGGNRSTEYRMIEDKLPQRPAWESSRGVKPASPVQPVAGVAPMTPVAPMTGVAPMTPEGYHPCQGRGSTHDSLSVITTVKATVKKERAKTGALLSLAEPDLPEWMPRDAWDAYLKMRKGKRGAKVTPEAIALLIRKLDGWRQDGQNVREILERSVMNGWTGLFPVKEQSTNGQTRKQHCDVEANYRAIYGTGKPN